MLITMPIAIITGLSDPAIPIAKAAFLYSLLCQKTILTTINEYIKTSAEGHAK